MCFQSTGLSKRNEETSFSLVSNARDVCTLGPDQIFLLFFSPCSRFEVHYEDALSFLSNWKGPKFDVVIMDICDPIEAGPGLALYFKEFYQSIARQVENILMMISMERAQNLD